MIPRTFAITLLTILLSLPLAQASQPLPLDSPALGMSAALTSRLRVSVFETENVREQSTCTAFPITEDGYLLTALHCVRECLLAQALGEQGALPQLGLEDLFVAKRPADTRAHCPEIKIKAIGVDGVDVLATGPALALYDSNFFSTFSDLRSELSSRGWDRKANDFAILKVATPAKLSCLRIHEQTAKEDPLFAVGFPVEGKGDLPAVISASAGHEYSAVEESQFFQQQKTAASQAWVRALFASPGVIFSNASNDWGQSGGPVVGLDGSLLGVVSGFTSSSVNGAEMHELVAVSVAAVLSSLPSSIAEAIQEKNLACAP